MENSRQEGTADPREEVQNQGQPGDLLSEGLHEALFKLLNFQATVGADQNNTMVLLALMNLLGIVNCMNKILPEVQKVRGTGELAGQIAGMLGGTAPAPAPAVANAFPGIGGIDPSLLAALAGMLGGPGLGQGAGGLNPTALLAMLANMMGPGPMRPPEPARHKEAPVRDEKPPQPEEKPKPVRETPKRETAFPRGVLKWDPRLG